jgi:hypothetical protein
LEEQRKDNEKRMPREWIKRADDGNYRGMIGPGSDRSFRERRKKENERQKREKRRKSRRRLSSRDDSRSIKWKV